jgi:hypothetical protein
VTCLNCDCPRASHEHNHHAVYCGRCEDCNRYKPRRERWWQIWRNR